MYIKEEHMFQISIRYVGKVRIPAKVREVMNYEFESEAEVLTAVKILSCVYSKSGIVFTFYKQGELL